MYFRQKRITFKKPNRAQWRLYLSELSAEGLAKFNNKLCPPRLLEAERKRREAVAA